MAPGLLSWPAWEALRAAAVVLAPAGHPQLPAVDAAGIAYRVVEELVAELFDSDEVTVWLPMPGADPPLPADAQLTHGSADLPGAHLLLAGMILRSPGVSLAGRGTTSTELPWLTLASWPECMTSSS